MDKYEVNGDVSSKRLTETTDRSQEQILINVSSNDEAKNTSKSSTEKRKHETATYSIRHFILILFCLYSMSNAFQWIEYAIISNIISAYYDVDEQTVTWTSVIYMIVYIPLIFPASWLLDKKGLRFVVLLGSFGTCIGSWIKCASVAPNRFTITMVGQTVTAVSQIFILGIPPRLAAVWYSADGVSRACAVGVFGNQLGVALGFLLPPIIVRNSTNKDDIGYDLMKLFYGVAGFTTVLFLLILIAFKDRPPKPPSRAQAAIWNSDEHENYWKSIASLLKNINYTLLLITYGINVGVFYAVSTLLNQVVLLHFPGAEQTAGWMGLTIVLTGMLGSVVCGYILDKTHKFKETTTVVYVLSLIGMLSYTLAIRMEQIIVVFVLAALLGFFMTGYLPLGFEFAAEITYPQSEGTSSGLLNASAQLFGIVFTTGASALLHSHGDLYSNLFLAGVLLIGSVMTAFIKSELLRQRAAQARLSIISTRLMNGQSSEHHQREEVIQRL